MTTQLHSFKSIEELRSYLQVDWRRYFELENPTEEICEYVLSLVESASMVFSLLDADQQTDKICDIAIKRDRLNFRLIKKTPNNQNKISYMKYRRVPQLSDGYPFGIDSVEATEKEIVEIVCNENIDRSQHKLQLFKNVTFELFIKIMDKLKCEIPGFDRYKMDLINKHPEYIKYIALTTDEVAKAVYNINKGSVFLIQDSFKNNEMKLFEKETIVELAHTYIMEYKGQKPTETFDSMIKKCGLTRIAAILLISKFFNEDPIKVPPTKTTKDPLAFEKGLPEYNPLDILNKPQTYEMCMVAVKHNGMLLKYAKNKQLEICIEAVKNNKLAIKYVTDDDVKATCAKIIEELSKPIVIIDPNQQYFVKTYNPVTHKVYNKTELELLIKDMNGLKIVKSGKTIYLEPDNVTYQMSIMEISNNA